MRFEDLLVEQIEELKDKYEMLVSDNDDSVDGLSFGEWAEGYDYSEDDFGCTANRDYMSYDLMMPGYDRIVIDDEDVRALEKYTGHVIFEQAQVLQGIRQLLDDCVEKYGKEE